MVSTYTEVRLTTLAFFLRMSPACACIAGEPVLLAVCDPRKSRGRWSAVNPVSILQVLELR